VQAPQDPTSLGSSATEPERSERSKCLRVSVWISLALFLMTWLTAAYGVAHSAAARVETSISAVTQVAPSSSSERSTDPARALETETGSEEAGADGSEWEPEPDLEGVTKGERTRRRFAFEHCLVELRQPRDGAASPRRPRGPPAAV